MKQNNTHDEDVQYYKEYLMKNGLKEGKLSNADYRAFYDACEKERARKEWKKRKRIVNKIHKG